MSKLFIYMIKLYKNIISPHLPPSCRFYPTCSEYTINAITKYGAIKGVFLGTLRILRCNPLCKGGYDPLK